MPRKKIKDGRVKIYYLDKETIDQIKRDAGIHEMSESSYLDFLVSRDTLSQNPVKQVKEIQLKKEILQNKLKELDKKEKEAVENATRIHEWQEIKRTKKPQAIRFIMTKINENDLNGAENAAKTWSRMTGMSAMQLLTEAHQKIKRGM